MQRRARLLVLTLMLLPVLAGCGKIRYPAYYTLDLPAPPDPAGPEGARASIAVREFQSANYLQQGAIVYRATPEEIGFYEYHRWAADPRQIVTTAVIDHLRARGLYAAVSEYTGRPDDGYILSGRLEKLEEVDESAGVRVQVAISAQITNGKSGATVWSNTITEVGAVSKRTVPGVVSEMNTAVESAIGELVSTIPALPAPPKDNADTSAPAHW